MHILSEIEIVSPSITHMNNPRDHLTRYLHAIECDLIILQLVYGKSLNFSLIMYDKSKRFKATTEPSFFKKQTLLTYSL